MGDLPELSRETLLALAKERLVDIILFQADMIARKTEIISCLEKSVHYTYEQLPRLKEAGVVDAGALAADRTVDSLDRLPDDFFERLLSSSCHAPSQVL